MKIFILVKDALLREAIIAALEAGGHECLSHYELEEGKVFIRDFRPELSILDLEFFAEDPNGDHLKFFDSFTQGPVAGLTFKEKGIDSYQSGDPRSLFISEFWDRPLEWDSIEARSLQAVRNYGT